jgi:hypothetical protein
MLISEELSTYIRAIKPANHIILFYDTLESKRKILASFLADGTEKGRGMICVCADETPDQVRNGLRANGFDVDSAEETGNLLIRSYDGWYIDQGKAEPFKIINRWKEAYQDFHERGMGMRITGEVSCFFEQGLVRELLRYEYALHRILDIPMEAICAYNVQTIVNTGYTEMIMPLVRAHGGAIFTSQSGSMILEPENVEDDDVEKLLDIKI